MHETRESADYALALLQAGRTDRAHEVLDALTALQVTDPTDEHYGIWGYFMEEPPDQMAPADWNWADFIGIRLAQILKCHQLRPETRESVEAALHHAALSIFRRNVGSRYTNIALLGAVTSAAVGELLAQPYLLEYARVRLRAMLERLERDGGFAEYNSPAYSPFLLEIVERAHVLVDDPEFMAEAERLRVKVWETIAERFHPGTGQLAGPQARAYADWIRPSLAAYLAEQTGAPIEARAGVEDEEPPRLFPSLPCPPRAAGRFAKLPDDPVVVRTRFDTGPRGDIVGTTWLTEDACLGTIDEEFGWIQRRPLLGYWHTPDDQAVVLRARMIHNGHDLTAAWCRQVQDGPRALSGWWLSYDSGDFHPNLDKPDNSVFDVGDLRLMVTLRGRGVSGKSLGAGAFALVAGARRAVVHTAPAEFLGAVSVWEVSEHEDEVRVETVLYSGQRNPVDFHDAVLRAAFAVEMLAEGEEPAVTSLYGTRPGDGSIHWRWDDLAVSTPDHPTPFEA